MKLAKLTLVKIAFIVFASTGLLHAADGDLDPDFGVFGKLTLDFSGGNEIISDVAVLEDGSIVIAGKLHHAFGIDIFLVKFNSNGSLADEFGTGGIVVTDFGAWEEATAIHVLPDNQLLVAGFATSSGLDFILLKYDSNGALDTSFGSGNGYVITAVTPGADWARAIAVQSSGRIIVAGTADAVAEELTTGNIGLAGYTSNGELDPAFGINGIMNLGPATGESALDMILQDDDRILIAGSLDDSLSSSKFLLARYTAAGIPDGNFGDDGLVSLDLTLFVDRAKAIALQPDGKIILGGFVDVGPSDGTRDMALARFDSQGNPDPDFGNGGVVIQDLGGDLLPGNEEIYDIAVQNDGKILAAGNTDILQNNGHYMIARFHSNGTLDTTFNGGVVFTDFGPAQDSVTALSLSNNFILAAGYKAIPGAGYDIAMARYLLDANLPPTGDCAGALFCDLFDDNILSPDWAYLKPSWNESGGSLVGTPSGKKALAYQTLTWTASNIYTIHTSMKSSGGEFSSVWLLGWYKDKKNGVELQMKEGSDKWILKHRVNGVVVAKAKGIKTIQPYVAYNVKVAFDGDEFQVFVDDTGTPLITLQATHPVLIGTVGYQVKNSNSTFDFIRVD